MVTSISVPAAEAAVAMAPSVGPPVITLVVANAVGIVALLVASRGITGKWGAELPPVPVPRWESATGAEPAPRGGALAEERGRPFKTEVARTL